jgi:hypothetical protein
MATQLVTGGASGDATDRLDVPSLSPGNPFIGARVADFSMRRISGVLSSTAAIAMIAMLAIGAAGATQGTSTYSVQFSAQGVSNSYKVTETVTPTSNLASDTLYLAVASGSSNFTYSRSVNSSLALQPFLPSITNQSFTYAANGTSVTLQITQNGTVPITFNGGSYKLTSYKFSAEFSAQVPAMDNLSTFQLPAMYNLSTIGGATTGGAMVATISGAISAFPSGLVYSLRGSVNGTSTFAVTLLSTNLPLNADTVSAGTQVASAGIGAGAVITALALALGVRSKQNKKLAQSKPEHWVD